MAKKKVVVAFSGGLDTSYNVMYLTREMGYDVYAACANTGGFSEQQLKENEERAYQLGAKKYVTLDVTGEYYEKSMNVFAAELEAEGLAGKCRELLLPMSVSQGPGEYQMRAILNGNLGGFVRKEFMNAAGAS